MKRTLIRDGLSREHFTEERIAALAKELSRDIEFDILSQEEREVSRHQILASRRKDEDIWIFGYGSLMWNPALDLVESRPALLSGYHRQFCLWMPAGRGSPERPGLMLALQPGGRCRGMAMRIAAELVEQETQIVWRREMIVGSYRPRWVRVQTDNGALMAITFVVETTHPRYAGRLPWETMAESIAFAEGRLGRCRDYLHNLVSHLDQLGVADGPMHRLLQEVDARRETTGMAAPEPAQDPDRP